ncbi:hypothetical protein BDM02DRAFT_489659 [Thelephora ganbajun]|uniref:Uncharacterized protein n=1 Tax=Thelephora ganbajun TaxID=370292 RepID=A0ACB6Z7R1_THEGA|nr:hypothetical protein BDM02DRAFT_489659 [Thelephora ganbajun]
MGRPLFSVNYSQPHPAVHVDLEPPDEHPPVCERWSYSKPFDPDSEEFFLDEIYEAPIDPATLENRDQAPLSPIDDVSSSESGSSVDEADRSEREALIRARDVIDSDAAGVVRRVNQASEQRLRTEATNNLGGNQSTAGPRTIIPISLNTAPGRPQPVVIPSPQTPTFAVPSTPPSVSIMATPGASFPFRASPQDATPRFYTWERDNHDPHWAVRASFNPLPSPSPSRRTPVSHWHVNARGVRNVAF